MEEETRKNDHLAKILTEIRTLGKNVENLQQAISGNAEIGHTGLAEQIRLNTRRIKILKDKVNDDFEDLKGDIDRNFEEVDRQIGSLSDKTDKVVMRTNAKLGVVGVIGGLAGTLITALIMWFRDID